MSLDKETESVIRSRQIQKKWSDILISAMSMIERNIFKSVSIFFVAVLAIVFGIIVIQYKAIKQPIAEVLWDDIKVIFNFLAGAFSVKLIKKKDKNHL